LGVVEKLILDVRLGETRLLLLLPQREDDDFNIEPLLLLLKELLGKGGNGNGIVETAHARKGCGTGTVIRKRA